MSFQDFAASNKRARPPRSGDGAPDLSTVQESDSPASAASSPPPSSGAGSDDPYSKVSDGIVQYRRNVAVLQNKIASKFGSSEDGPELQRQYRTQLDVIHQLGRRIESQLRRAEGDMKSMERAERDRSRAAHAKLTRDYRRVEQTFKNVQLDVRKRRGLAEARRREAEEDEERRRLEGGEGGGDDVAALQRRLEDDRIAEEIMREREEEIRNINKGMHTVNEIYKELGTLVSGQQEQVDQVEEHMEDANANAEAGLKQVEKANIKADSPYQCVVS